MLMDSSGLQSPSTWRALTSTNTIVFPSFATRSISPSGHRKFRSRILIPLLDRCSAAALSPSFPLLYRLLIIDAALRPGQDAIKSDPVQRTWPMPANGLAMAGGAIAFVGIKSVLRKCFVKLTHQAVAMDLGDYGCGCNGDRKAVSLHNSLLLYLETKFVWAVDEEEIGLYCQL